MWVCAGCGVQVCEGVGSRYATGVGCGGAARAANTVFGALASPSGTVRCGGGAWLWAHLGRATIDLPTAKTRSQTIWIIALQAFFVCLCNGGQSRSYGIISEFVRKHHCWNRVQGLRQLHSDLGFSASLRQSRREHEKCEARRRPSCVMRETNFSHLWQKRCRRALLECRRALMSEAGALCAVPVQLQVVVSVNLWCTLYFYYGTVRMYMLTYRVRPKVSTRLGAAAHAQP